MIAPPTPHNQVTIVKKTINQTGCRLTLRPVGLPMVTESRLYPIVRLKSRKSTSTTSKPKKSTPYGWSLGIVTTTLITLFVGGVLLFGVQVDDQIARARTHIDEAETMIHDLANEILSLRSVISSTPFIHQVLEDPPANQGLRTKIPDGFMFGSSTGTDEESAESQQTDSGKAMASVEQDAIKASTKKAASVLGGVFKTTFGLLINLPRP